MRWRFEGGDGLFVVDYVGWVGYALRVPAMEGGLADSEQDASLAVDCR